MVKELLELHERFDEMQMFQVIQESIDVLVHVSGGRVAPLNLFKLQVLGKSLQEASNELGSGDKVKSEHLCVVSICVHAYGCLLDRDSLGKSHGGIDTSLEIAAAAPVGLLLGQISLDSPPVKEPVLANGLSKSLGRCEDRGPGFNSSNIIVHVLAVLEISGHLAHE